jgi:hypothetical protein
MTQNKPCEHEAATRRRDELCTLIALIVKTIDNQVRLTNPAIQGNPDVAHWVRHPGRDLADAQRKLLDVRLKLKLEVLGSKRTFPSLFLKLHKSTHYIHKSIKLYWFIIKFVEIFTLPSITCSLLELEK